MNIEDSIALVTGASRGIGRALVEALVLRGARKVYAAARNPDDVVELARAHEGKVVPVRLDVTSEQDLAALAGAAPDVTLLINNAGTLSAFDLLGTPRAQIERELATNFFGPLGVTRALLPALEARREAAVVNVLTLVSLASMPGLGAYSATKAAAFSLTQALRAQLAPKGIHVHAVFPGPVDTEMARDIKLPKARAPAVAEAILDGVARGDEDIAPDPMSQQVLPAWRRDPKEIERQFGAM
jgi:NAD(P)-dependent dehydrogenase (short-subunit alcohol dehydrogenase family)